MSMIDTYKDSARPNWLASERALRLVTFTATQAFAVTENGEMIVKSGTVYPSNDQYAEGIIFEDVKVTAGDAPGSLMTSGHIYENRLSVTLESAAQSALAAKGIILEQAAGLERAYD